MSRCDAWLREFQIVTVCWLTGLHVSLFCFLFSLVSALVAAAAMRQRLRQFREGMPVQGVLFDAMRKAKLIGEGVPWQQLNYSRCGRTDKGVSAAGQVRACLHYLCFCKHAITDKPNAELFHPCCAATAAPHLMLTCILSCC